MAEAMNRRSSSGSSSHRRRRRSSFGKYESPSPERVYRRARSPSTGRSRSRKPAYDEPYEKYSRRSASPASDEEKTYKVLCVSALHVDASDDVIKDVLYTEYKRFGDFAVRMARSGNERVAYVVFKTSEDARDAMKHKRRVSIFDKIAIVEPVYQRPAREERYRSRSRSPDMYYRRFPDPARYYDRFPYMQLPPEYRRDLMPLPGMPPHDLLPFPPMMHPLPPPLFGPRPFMHPYLPFQHLPFAEPKKFPNYLHHIPPEDDALATRTLFAGNLDIGTTKEDLKRLFGAFGVIEDVDVKRPAQGTVVGGGTAYAFVRFKNLDMAHKAKVELSGKFLGKYQLKIGYGKATPTTRVWVGGLGPWTASAQLEREFDRFGAIKKIEYDEEDGCAYILYDSIDAATSAVKEMRGFPLGGPDRKLRVDFADVGSASPRKSDRRGSDDDYEYRSTRRKYNGDRYYEGKDDNFDWKNHYEDKHKRSSRHRKDSSELGSAYSLSDITHKCKVTWEGAFILKNSLFPVRFHLTDGSQSIIDFLDQEPSKMLKITQRLHLNPAKLDDVGNHIKTSASYGIFLAIPSSKVKLSFADSTLQTKSLQNLISYLRQKQAAGVLSFAATKEDAEPTGVLYAFPPCSYASELLKRTAYSLADDHGDKDHLVVVVIKGQPKQDSS